MAWLRQLELKNFGKHKYFKQDFVQGLVLIRGENEAGKSTIGMGVAYNWFGSSALVDNFEDTVHWGSKRSALKTSTVIATDSCDYECLRSASGAELRKNGQPIVTGHTEVTAAVCDILGIGVGLAPQTILANQNEIRGILALGPTAAAQFIEKLGNFGQIDRLIKQVTDQIPVGTITGIEEIRARRNEELEREKAKPLQDVSKEKAHLKTVENHISKLASEIDMDQRSLNKINLENEKVAGRQKMLVAEQHRIEQQNNKLRKDRQEYEAAVAEGPKIRAKLSELELQAKNHQVYTAYQQLKAIKTSVAALAVVWEGSEEELATTMDKLSSDITKTSDELATVRGSIKTLKNQLVTEDVCPTCGTVLKDKKEVDRCNHGVQQKITAEEQEAWRLVEKLAKLKDEFTLLSDIFSTDIEIKAALGTLEPFVKADYSQVPVQLSWIGEVPNKVDAVDVKKMAQLQATLDRVTQAESLLKVMAHPDSSRLKEIASELQELVLTPTESLEDVLRIKRAELEALQKEFGLLSKKISDVDAEALSRKATIKRLQKEIEDLDREILEIQENNTFVRTLKEARLRTIDVLWTKVLVGVSAYFSRLRGTPSVVSRDQKGFMVDGKHSSPSGSTLDILGLALRITVSKMFASCGFLWVDEASAGCDDTRTVAMTSTLANAGFEQVVLISHKDIDEAGADLLITI